MIEWILDTLLLGVIVGGGSMVLLAIGWNVSGHILCVSAGFAACILGYFLIGLLSRGVWTLYKKWKDR